MKIEKMSEVARHLPSKWLMTVKSNKRFMVGQPQLAGKLIDCQYVDREEDILDAMIRAKCRPDFPTMVVDLKS